MPASCSLMCCVDLDKMLSLSVFTRHEDHVS